MADCTHLDQIHDVKPSSNTCQRCIEEGMKPVTLRMCRVCGNVACCDTSIGRHATKHFEETGHAIMQIFPDENPWSWCFIDKILVDD